jgi:hypothetical protein
MRVTRRVLLPRLASLLEEGDVDLFAESALRLFWSRPQLRVVDLAQRRLGQLARERGWSERM